MIFGEVYQSMWGGTLDYIDSTGTAREQTL